MRRSQRLFFLVSCGLVVLMALSGCEKTCSSSTDCSGKTPVCDAKKCDCLANKGCLCTDACNSDADCSGDFFCNGERFCEVRAGRTDPDCGR